MGRCKQFHTWWCEQEKRWKRQREKEGGPKERNWYAKNDAVGKSSAVPVNQLQMI